MCICFYFPISTIVDYGNRLKYKTFTNGVKVSKGGKKMTMVSIIVPTYNERKNMRPLIERIYGSIKGMKHEIIVVDDNSQDGTARVVKELSRKYPVKLVVRKNERGLATAVLEGFKHAKGDVYAVIDADLQHPPETLVPLIYEACNGTDIAIGSRYARSDGKETFGDFKVHRKMMSKGANLLAKVLVPKVANVKDIQSGFFAMKKSVIQDVELKPTGYKILLEILAIGKYKVVKEVPYDFGQREYGESKLGAATIFDYLHHLLTLTVREKESKRFINFIATGVVGTAIGTGLLWYMTEMFGIFYIVSAAISKELGTIMTFALNERFVFKDRISPSMKTVKKTFSRLIKFNINRLAATVIVIAATALFTEVFGIHYVISNLIGICIAFPFNFFVSNGQIWKDANDGKENADNGKIGNAETVKIIDGSLVVSKN